MQQTKGFIFDLDGVIVDTAKYHFLAWRSLANQLGFDFTENDNEKLKGISRVKSLEMILEWGNITLPEEEFNKQMALKNEEYLAHISDMNASEILPDVEKTLEYLKNKQQKIALGSASKNASPILERVGLLDTFKVIVDGNAVTKGKPNPEVFLKGAKGLDLNPEACIVFEDSISGIQAANKANMVSIGIGDPKVLHEADYVFKDFTEISEAFINKLIENENATLKQN